MKKKLFFRYIVVMFAAFCVICLVGVAVSSVSAIRDVRQQSAIPTQIGTIRSLVQNVVKHEFVARLLNEKSYSLGNEKIELVDKILSSLSRSNGSVADFVEKNKWYYTHLNNVNMSWRKLKREILNIRNGEDPQRLLKESEQYQVNVNFLMISVENVFNQRIENMLTRLMIVSVLFVLMVGVTCVVLLLNVATKKKAARLSRIMLDATPMACTIRDAEGNILDCNKKALDLFGFKTREDLIKNFEAINPIHQPDGALSSEKVNGYIQTVLKNGSVQYRWTYKTLSGETIPVDTIAMNVSSDKHGKPLIGFYSRDRREILAQDKKIQDANERTRIMLDVMPMASAIWDEDLHPIDCNYEAVRLHKLKSKEEYMEKFFDLSPKEQPDHQLSRTAVLEWLKKAFRTGREQVEWIHLTSDGEQIYTNIRLIRVPWDNGYRVVSYVQDLREVKKNERAMREANEQISAALQEAELYSKAKSNFLSRVSHEMLTPMNAIMGMSKIAETADDTRRARCFDEIHQASEDLLSIIHNMLDMARMEAGNFELFPAKFNFYSAMGEMTQEISKPLKKKDQKFIVDIDESIMCDFVYADEKRLRRILTNLLSNAIKFTPEYGTVEFHVRKQKEKRKEENGKTVVSFKVSDTGCGFSDKEKARLWGIFEQSDNSISRSYGGVGLGLSIANLIIKKMGGQLHLKSELGEGSEFTFTLALDVAEDTERTAPAQAQQAIPATLEDFNLSGQRVLIVDDVSLNREILSTLLEDTGALLDCAEDGQEAVKLFCQNPYDIVLMDLHMPGMDGFEATQRIRESGVGKCANIPIIAVTADTSDEVISRCTATGMNAHVGKPVDYDTLVDTLAHCYKPSLLTPPVSRWEKWVTPRGV
ncbi:hypothetical protein AGMMS50276_02540 [Synergistales bacterium]|nr:hypothetical protein AGMMS50276_02540 [Synergistales bacterium]